ncbi:hypothetical protein D3C73_1102250 [compost metagenome]
MHADLHALEVCKAAYRFFGVDVACATVHPGQGDQVEFGVGDLVENLVADCTVDDLAHVRLVAEHERHVEHVHVRHHRPDDTEADASHLDRTDLGLLDHFLLGTEYATGEHLEGQFAVALGDQGFAQLLFRHDGRVAGRVDVGEFDFQRMGGAAEGEGQGECSGEKSAFEVHWGCLQCCYFFCIQGTAVQQRCCCC